jgi:hypothetical protein
MFLQKCSAWKKRNFISHLLNNNFFVVGYTTCCTLTSVLIILKTKTAFADASGAAAPAPATVVECAKKATV